MQDHEFKQFIERVKLRVPIEDAVSVRVPGLRRAGSLWEACCPFHEERTPSFKVDPRRGTWHCYGACSDGGDVISFVQRFDGTDFWEALEALANQAGEELPARRARGGDDRKLERHYDVLRRAQEFYTRSLWGEQGAEARSYLERRGLVRNTLEAFGLGWAPGEGSPLLAAARGQGTATELLSEVGLVRTNDEGRTYDFFRGRLMIPIRDRRGRTVGFGARTLRADAGERGIPKYVNTPETLLFKKSRLIYGLDRAGDSLRRGKHLVLVEGYTDVMAAHQVGLGHVCAVLGTATTEDHAALVRRSGARRVTLLFDGDAAGAKAAKRALHGLLPLAEVELMVAILPEGDDPCDLLVRDGEAGLAHVFEGARSWFDHLCAQLPMEASPQELSAALDEVLELVGRIPREVERALWVRRLAQTVSLPEDSLVAQLGRILERRSNEPGARRSPSVAASRREEQPRAALPGQTFSGQTSSGQAFPGQAFPGQAPPAQDEQWLDAQAQSPDGPDAPAQDAPRPLDPGAQARLHQRMTAYAELAGACLLEPTLVPALEAYLDELDAFAQHLAAHPREARACEDMGELMRGLVRLSDREERGELVLPARDEDLPGHERESALLTELGAHSAREHVARLAELARRAESPALLADGAMERLEELSRRLEIQRGKAALQAPSNPEEELRMLQELHQRLRESKVPPPAEGGTQAGSDLALEEAG